MLEPDYNTKETVFDILSELIKKRKKATSAEIKKMTDKFHARIDKDNLNDDKKNQLLQMWDEALNSN